jgi:hypothetical protein
MRRVLLSGRTLYQWRARARRDRSRRPPDRPVGCRLACCGMREGIRIKASAADRDRLERIVADRNNPQKHVWRALIILATVQGCGTAEIVRRAEVSKPSVWRWEERFMREAVAGLVRDKTRRPCRRPRSIAWSR